MSQLNLRFRRKNYPTDVLSFPAPKAFWAQGQLGELILCLPTLKRQAIERGHSAEVELQVLVVHGVLHLLGLDHEGGTKEAAQMAKWERRLLQSLGFSPKRALGLIDLSRSREVLQKP